MNTDERSAAPPTEPRSRSAGSAAADEKERFLGESGAREALSAGTNRTFAAAALWFLVSCAFASAADLKPVAHNFELKRPAEVALKLRASAPGTSWGKAGAEAAVLRVELDGAYNQHVTLFMGAAPHDYNVLLGALGAGKHEVRISLDSEISSPGAREFEAALETSVHEPGSPGFDEMRRAPILYARPDTIGRASDTPLLAWYEWLPPSSDAPAGAARMLQYSYVFSNEDGGTNTPALMARWGRTTDIEHVYRIFFDTHGADLGTIFQGVEHKEKPFHGAKLGEHLLIGVASRNNNFSDEAASKVRVALVPEAFDLSRHSREEVMDRHPWSYQVMSLEMEREGKLKEIGDLRGYLYLEAHIQTTAAAASFGVVLNDGRAFRSDAGLPGRRIERSGWVRSTVQLPPGTSLNNIRQVIFFCDPPEKPPKEPRPPSCSVDAISKLFFLGRDFLPEPATPVTVDAKRLAPGGKATFDVR